jgi:hypothetical protein
MEVIDLHRPGFLWLAGESGPHLLDHHLAVGLVALATAALSPALSNDGCWAGIRTGGPAGWSVDPQERLHGSGLGTLCQVDSVLLQERSQARRIGDEVIRSNSQPWELTPTTSPIRNVRRFPGWPIGAGPVRSASYRRPDC